jgi:hypothetical protein
MRSLVCDYSSKHVFTTKHDNIFECLRQTSGIYCIVVGTSAHLIFGAAPASFSLTFWDSVPAQSSSTKMTKRKIVLTLVPKYSRPTNLRWAKTHRSEDLQFLWVAAACTWSVSKYQILVDDFNKKLSTENIFKWTLGNKGLCETSHDNSVSAQTFAISKAQRAQHTIFS